MKFDLHIHSACSDGHDSVKTILKIAARRGLDGIAITDHDTLSGFKVAQKIIKEKNFELIILPGAEVTTSQGHLLVLGVEKLPALGLSPEDTIDETHDQDGISIVPHPYHPFRHAIGRIPDCDAVEAYNSKHLFGIANACAKVVAKRRSLPIVAGSDSHFAATVGLGVTEIDAQSAEDAIAAIRSGRTRIIGKRTPPKFFIGNTFQAIYTEVRRGMHKPRRI